MIFQSSEKVLCSFCKLSHRVYFKKELSYFDAVLLLFITGLLAFAIWGGPDLRSMVIFMGMAFALQVFLRVRYRESIKCPHCGFDPILYKRGPRLAARRVKTFLKQRHNNPAFLLKPQPNIKPLYITKEERLALEKSGEWDELLDAAFDRKNEATPGSGGERTLSSPEKPKKDLLI